MFGLRVIVRRYLGRWAELSLQEYILRKERQYEVLAQSFYRLWGGVVVVLEGLNTDQTLEIRIPVFIHIRTHDGCLEYVRIALPKLGQSGKLRINDVQIAWYANYGAFGSSTQDPSAC